MFFPLSVTAKFWVRWMVSSFFFNPFFCRADFFPGKAPLVLFRAEGCFLTLLFPMMLLIFFSGFFFFYDSFSAMIPPSKAFPWQVLQTILYLSLILPFSR